MAESFGSSQGGAPSSSEGAEVSSGEGMGREGGIKSGEELGFEDFQDMAQRSRDMMEGLERGETDLKTLDLDQLQRHFRDAGLASQFGSHLISGMSRDRADAVERSVSNPSDTYRREQYRSLREEEQERQKRVEQLLGLKGRIGDEMLRRGDEGLRTLVDSERESTDIWVDYMVKEVRNISEERRRGGESKEDSAIIEKDLDIENLLLSAKALEEHGLREGQDLEEVRDQIEQLKQKEAEDKTREFYEKIDRQTKIFEKNKVGLFERAALTIIQKPEEIKIQDRRAVQASMNTFELIDSMNKMRKDAKMPEIPAENVVKKDTLEDMRRAVEQHEDLVKQVEDIRNRKFKAIEEQKKKKERK